MTREESQTIGRRIQTLRRAAGMSQETLAAAVGVSRQALGKWESDLSPVSYTHLDVYKRQGRKPLSVRIAEALGAFRVRWTVRPEDEPAAREKENDCVIFEFYRPEPRFH